MDSRVGKAEGILAKEGGCSGEGEEEKERNEAGGKKAVRERAKNVRPENKRRRGETGKLGDGNGEKMGMARMGKGE